MHVATCRNKIHGKSLLPLLRGEEEKLRDNILYGYFGKSVNITDGKYTYFRSAVREDNLPLNLYCAIPTTICQYYGHEVISDFSRIEMGRCLNWTDYPVYKIPSEIIDFGNRAQKFTNRGPYNNENLLFDIENDYLQKNPLVNEDIEAAMLMELQNEMVEHDAPEEQFARLGMK